MSRLGAAGKAVMVYWGGVLVTVTAAGYLLGRKELPKLAHFVGNLSGRSVGAIIRAKKEFFDATKDNEIVKVSTESDAWW